MRITRRYRKHANTNVPDRKHNVEMQKRQISAFEHQGGNFYPILILTALTQNQDSSRRPENSPNACNHEENVSAPRINPIYHKSGNLCTIIMLTILTQNQIASTKR
jgi:hypothetical protein